MEQPKRVVITGMGCVSPLGLTFNQTVESLREARDCVSPVTAFDVSRCHCTTAGQLPDDHLDAATSIDSRAARWSSAACMVLLALSEARAADPDFTPDAALFGTTSGGMHLGERFYRAVAARQNLRHARRWIREYFPQQPILDAAWSQGWEIPCRIISNACASGSNAVGHAFLLVRSGRASRVLCGGYDALCELVFAGFDSLRAATPEKCRPFDAHRSGLVLGEGAAVFFVESFDAATRRGAPILAEITGYGATTDNHHLTQPNPDGNGPRRAMEQALVLANALPDSVDYINAHGTATPFNDASEGRAIADLCPRVAVSSTKGQMGHSLGAAGAIEAAFCVIALRERFLPANIHYQTPDPTLPLDIVANAIRPTAPRRILSNSFGFGGANASLVLETFAS
jgi:3-oxoacyl-[acyl-carrier-protein] synthase II